MVRPLQPESPNPLLVLAVAVVAGGMLGLCWLLLDGAITAVRQREIATGK